jgi:hypothetical protein
MLTQEAQLIVQAAATPRHDTCAARNLSAGNRF